MKTINSTAKTNKTNNSKSNFIRYATIILTSLVICIAATLICTNQSAQIAVAKTAENTQTANANTLTAEHSETIADKYLVMKGSPGPSSEATEISNFIKIAMEPIGHAMYIYGGGWNEADDGGGIEANTVGVSKSWKDFERKQDSEYTNLIEELDYTVHKEVIHYGLDCSAYLGWVYYNMFNDNQDHVTFACDMAEELVDKGLATKTRDVEEGTGTNTFTPGDILTSGGHCWICLGKCSDGSVLTLQSQGVSDETQLDKYEGVSIYGTKTPDGSKDSEAIALANEYLDRYYPNFNSKFKKGYSNEDFLTDYDEYTWNSAYDAKGLQGKTAEQVMAILFDETAAEVTCSATGTEPIIRINRATVSANTGMAQAYDTSQDQPGTVDITLKVPFNQQFTSVSVNGTDYSSMIPQTKQALCDNFEDGYTTVKITGIRQNTSYAITTSTEPATTYGVGVTTWEFDKANSADANSAVGTLASSANNAGADSGFTNIAAANSSNGAISKIENATIQIESITIDGTEITQPDYYSGKDWVNDYKNGYGAFPADSVVKLKIIPKNGYQVDSVTAVPSNDDNAVSAVPSNGVASASADALAGISANTAFSTNDTPNNNEWTFTSPGGIFKLDVATSLISDPVNPTPEDNTQTGTTASTGDHISWIINTLLGFFK